MGNFACWVTPEDVTRKTSWTSSRVRTGRQFLDVFLAKWKFMKKSAVHEVRQKKINGTCRQTRGAGKTVLESAFRRGAPECTDAFQKKHKKLKGSNDMTTSWQVMDWKSQEKYKHTNRQTGEVHLFKNEQQTECTFHTEQNQQVDRQRQSHVSESGHKKY